MINFADKQFLGRVGLNYLPNPSGVNGTIGWSPFSTTFVNNVPTTITGPAPAFTILPQNGMRTSTFSVALGGATVGQGIISDVMVLDPADRAKPFSFNCDYRLNPGTGVNVSGTSSQTVEVWIYDALNLAWIQPAGYRGINQSGPFSGFLNATFQTLSTSTVYRVAFIVKNAPTASVQFEWAQGYFGPVGAVYGAPVTDWQSYTPTITHASGGITNATPTGKYRRVGDSIEVYGTITFSAASAAFTELFASLPSGLTFDTSKLSVTTSLAPVLGTAFVYDNGLTLFAPGNVAYRTSTTVDIRTPRTASGTNPGVNIVTDVLTNTVPITFASGDTINWHFTAPITGWSSSVQMSNDTDTRVVAARSISSNSGAWPTVDTVINYETVSYDTHGSITTGASWSYRVPVSGYWKVSASHQGTASGATTLILRARKNGSQFATGTFPVNAATSNIIVRVDGQNYFNAGDTIDIVASSSAATGTFVGSASASVVQIERLSGPSVIAASETVAARYYTTAGNPVTNNAVNYIDFATKDYDTHGMASGTGSGNVLVTNTGFKITIPVSGKYAISVSTISATGGGWAVNEIWETGVMRNGSDIQMGLAAAQTTHNTYMSSHLYIVANLVAGDRIEPRLFQNSGATLNMLASAPGLNNFSIVRVGN